MTPERPYLSLVLASRNDGYAGGMLRRMQVFIDAFLHQADRFALPAELIVVDWNPPPNRSLWDALRWPQAPTWCTMRFITVPSDLHATVPFSRALPILVHRARNVGVRRARGAFILPTSADILFSDELIEQFSRRELDAGTMYRIARHDVDARALDVENHDERLRFCQAHVIHVHDRAGSYRSGGVPQLFTNAAGDFTLMSRDSYFALRGIPEEREYHSAHFDGLFCFMAHAAGMPEVVFTEPCRMYHIDHGKASWKSGPTLLEQAVRRLPLKKKRSKKLINWARRVWPRRSGLERRGVPYVKAGGPATYDKLVHTVLDARGTFQYNAPDWGFGGHSFPERVIAASRVLPA